MVDDVGATMYCTVPEVALLGLVNVCAMVEPLPAVAPVMLPVIAPTDQLKVLGVEAASAIFVAVPLQMAAVFAVVTTGVGNTVTMIEYGAPGHAGDVVEVGTTIYSTVPADVLTGLFSV